jgi:phospholipase C
MAELETYTGRTRREALREIGTAGLGLTALGGGLDALLAQASAAATKGASLKEIEHVVILIQENRSFDHYFGTLSGVRGFGDRRGRAAFTQRDPGSGRTVTPFHLPTGCLPDLTHDWGPQHRAWDHRRMDGFLSAHDAVDDPGVGAETMGYYRRSDLNFYYALADAFTICDGYHCSVIGPTDPNRLMSMSASLDPAGTHGGPLVQTLVAGRGAKLGTFTWTTMPERLSAHGVSWKVYSSPAGGVFDNVLTYFKAYATGSKLAARGLDPTYPADFVADMTHGRLPQVSWVLTGIAESEHPGFSSGRSGEVAVRTLLESILAQTLGLEEDRALPDLGRERRLLRSRRAAGGAGRHQGRVPDRRVASVRGRRRPRPDRTRLPCPDARRLPVLTRWPRVLGHLRPHVDAPLHRDALRRRGAEPERLAP